MITADPPAPASATRDLDTEGGALDALTLGRRIREQRIRQRLTLEQLASAVDRAPSQVSMIENGKREPRLSMLRSIALALGTTVDELLRTDAPSERAGLEIAVERAQRGPVFEALGLPTIRVSKGQSDDTLRAILGLHSEIERLHRERAATPEEARRANSQLRAEMRGRDNYFAELEQAASALLQAVGHAGGPVSQQTVSDMASHLGYSLHYVHDLPHSTRSVTDKRNGRIYRFSPWYQYTDTTSGTFCCTSRIDKAKEGDYSVSVGVPFAHVKWFRGRETAHRGVSRCPDESCCRRAPGGLEEKWADQSWPAARTPTSLLAALPTGSFPGVDPTEVYQFLESHAPRA